jgi:hypothetical protein
LASLEKNACSKVKANAKLLRRDLRRVEQMMRYRRYTLDGVPILFANSFPKSGTHLLTQVLQGFTKIGPAVNSGLPAIVTFDSTTGEHRGECEIQREIHRLKPGDIGYGHVHSTDSVMMSLCGDGMASYFILRDPRDVVVSHVHYVTEIETNHIHHQYYQEELVDFDERLKTSILGRPDFGDLFPNIMERFEPYLGWLDCPQVLVLRFEDFVFERQKTIKRIYDHAIERGFTTAVNFQRAIEILSAGINPEKSPTFRSGKVGDWRARFSPQNKNLFKDVAGDLLNQLGYESTCDW